MARPKKGDRLVYTGDYAPEVIASGALYPPGAVVRFFTNRFHGPSVTVRLDRQPGGTEDLYADWPIDKTAPASEEGG